MEIRESGGEMPMHISRNFWPFLAFGINMKGNKIIPWIEVKINKFENDKNKKI